MQNGLASSDNQTQEAASQMTSCSPLVILPLEGDRIDDERRALCALLLPVRTDTKGLKNAEA